MGTENMNDSGDRLWTRFVRDALENSPEFSHAFKKEAELFRALASKGDLGERVTVMCCGDGREVGSLLDLHAEFPQIKELNAVDWLEISIDQVRGRIREKVDGLEGVTINLLQEDATATSIAPNSQDTVTCMLTMVNFKDEFLRKFFRHVHRILKPGGKFVFSVYNEKAFHARMALYEKIGAPIMSADPKTGYVAFEEGFHEADFSRQFTPDEFRLLTGYADLDVRSYDGDGITHLGILEKEKVRQKQVDPPAWVRYTVAASIAGLLTIAFADATDEAAKPAPWKEGEYTMSEVGPGIFMRRNIATGEYRWR